MVQIPTLGGEKKLNGFIVHRNSRFSHRCNMVCYFDMNGMGLICLEVLQGIELCHKCQVIRPLCVKDVNPHLQMS